ncbi:Recombinase zinc beta ribbon domain-containing protein [Ruminococcaceae bacterium FB2012]|nr:Recombinase zinc beta ribbon domain-containing protein [Ruminococcaceae bacterium FB2012]
MCQILRDRQVCESGMYLDGLSFGDIAKRLMEAGLQTKFGKKNWDKASVRSILINEKYVGDVILQKTYTIDCISHKAARNNGERPKYLVSDAHIPIIDRETYNLVQQELARRTSKRKKSDKTKSELGRYSSKYALTELMICNECGSVYRRTTWKRGPKRKIVWRCMSRLDHGTQYCKKSPSLIEESLHRAIMKAINAYFGNEETIKGILKSNVDSILSASDTKEVKAIEIRLREIDGARNDYISLIASGTVDRKEIDFPIADWTIVEKRAADLGVNVSLYIRKMAVGGEIITYSFNDLIPVFDNLNEIKKRLDQISVVARKTKNVNMEIITKAQIDIEQMRHDMIQFIASLKRKQENSAN